MMIEPGGDVRDNWKHHNALAGAVDAAGRIQDRHRDRVAEIPRVTWDHTFGNFPFKIYQALPNQIQPGEDPALPWRMFCLRSGQVNRQNLSGAIANSLSYGCDGHIADPTDDNIPSETDAGEQVTPILADNNVPNFYFWIELIAGVPVLHAGVDPTIAMAPPGSPAIVSAWENFPDNDGLHLLIGSVNTQTLYQPVITQNLSHHLNNMLSVSGCDETGATLNLLIPNALISS